jgi:putative tryptophan/tyrosine transport system substrate-binding protein
MRRRQFFGVVGGAASWSAVAHAQQAERVRRIGALAGTGGDDPAMQDRLSAFVQELTRLGWTIGRNLQLDER